MFNNINIFFLFRKDKKMAEKKLNCKYCGRKMHKFDYETYNGYCGKCREILEWRRTLDHLKESEE